MMKRTIAFTGAARCLYRRQGKQFRSTHATVASWFPFSDCAQSQRRNLLRPIPTTSRFFSQESPNDQDDSVKNNDQDKKSDTTNNNKPADPKHFPWRCSPVLLHRLMENDDLSGSTNTQMARLMRRTAAGRVMGFDLSNSVMFGLFSDEELADNLAWAFQKGLAGLLSRTFKIPINQIEKGTSGIDLDTTNHGPTNDTDNTNESTDAGTAWSEEQDAESAAYVDKTLEKALVDMYRSLDGPAWIVQLRMEPISWKLENIFPMPVLTRELTERKPSFKGYQTQMERIWREEQDLNKVTEMARSLKEVTEHTKGRTLVADLSVVCEEIFFVKDRATGEVLQGHDEPIRTTHLIRFEKYSEEGEKKTLGDWKIVDWDDMLEGNRWY